MWNRRGFLSLLGMSVAGFAGGAAQIYDLIRPAPRIITFKDIPITFDTNLKSYWLGVPSVDNWIPTEGCSCHLCDDAMQKRSA